MKLKRQPLAPTRPVRAAKPPRGRGASRPGRGRGASRPRAPIRSRLSGRLPSLRRVLAGLGAAAVAAALVALLNGPWLRVTDVAWAGEHYTDAADLRGVLATQRGHSVLAVDTRALRERLERMPSIERASVHASLTGTIQATVVEREAAFVWITSSARFVGAPDGTIFSADRDGGDIPEELATLPQITDERFAARLITVGDVIPKALLRTAMRVSAIDPVALGSDADGVVVRVDDEYGFRIVSDDPAWEVAFGVYGLDPRETAAEADTRLERQVTAVRTLFATEPEDEIGWVDVRNPGKVYFRAKG